MKHGWMIDTFTIVGFVPCSLVLIMMILFLGYYIYSEMTPRKAVYKAMSKLAKKEPKTFMRFMYFTKRKHKINNLGIEEI